MNNSKCIEPNTCRNKAGYSVKYFDGKLIRLHRLAFAVANGMDLVDLVGVVIRHKCDNRGCINPEHLESGTQKDNMKDMADRGRNRQPKGESNASSKLTEESVKEIRKKLISGMKHRDIAGEFGIDKSQISRINTRKIWSHIT